MEVLMITKYSIPIDKSIVDVESYAESWLADCLEKCHCDYGISDFTLKIESSGEGFRRALFELNSGEIASGLRPDTARMA